ncbi:hypothetical protein B0T18DRAFT_428707 [Schizothecium vesticola]|uniref:Uncharacterized protein n=1 Tax=Schizothecium vesticola TaxID=314040 RepID=A0AA40EU28_9PEZI|nr:hypothetical protein B0T18DRAFT_428707 [Schizothecium vesticola]
MPASSPGAVARPVTRARAAEREAASASSGVAGVGEPVGKSSAISSSWAPSAPNRLPTIQESALVPLRAGAARPSGVVAVCLHAAPSAHISPAGSPLHLAEPGLSTSRAAERGAAAGSRVVESSIIPSFLAPSATVTTPPVAGSGAPIPDVEALDGLLPAFGAMSATAQQKVLATLFWKMSAAAQEELLAT